MILKVLKVLLMVMLMVLLMVMVLLGAKAIKKSAAGADEADGVYDILSSEHTPKCSSPS